jgi:hypothetical protein
VSIDFQTHRWERGGGVKVGDEKYICTFNLNFKNPNLKFHYVISNTGFERDRLAHLFTCYKIQDVCPMVSMVLGCEFGSPQGVSEEALGSSLDGWLTMQIQSRLEGMLQPKLDCMLATENASLRGKVVELRREIDALFNINDNLRGQVIRLQETNHQLRCDNLALQL